MFGKQGNDIETSLLLVKSSAENGHGPVTYAAVPKDAQLGRRSRAVMGVPLVCASILIVELCERLAFYTFTGTQEFFLERLGYSVAASGAINATMGTLCTAWAFLAGWVADVWLGRYNTILLFGSIYVIGSLLATVAAWPASSNSRLYLAGVMGLVPIGTAGIKANISNFGADQYDVSDPKQAEAREKFFSWFYLAINLGSAVAYGGLTTIGASGGFGIPQKYGYFAVYALAAAVMQVAVMVFRAGRSTYRVQPTQCRSSLAGVANQVWAAARCGSGRASAFCLGVVLSVLGLVLSVTQALFADAALTSTLGLAAFLCSAVGISAISLSCLDPDWAVPDWVTLAGQSSQTLAPEDVRDYLRLLPVLLMANLAFSALYNSMQYWYQQQACQMDVRMPWGQSQFAGSFFMIADCLGIVIATPLALNWVNPALDKIWGTPLGHGARYSIGMAFGALSVLVAARIEVLRRAVPVMPLQSNCAPEGVHMSAMPASWMFVPFFLMGLGEIYTQPVLMHLAYSKSPATMRTLAVVTCLVIGAVSNALFTVEIAALSPFVPNDLNNGHLEYGHYANVALGGVFCMVYLASLRIFEEGGQDDIEELPL